MSFEKGHPNFVSPAIRKIITEKIRGDKNYGWKGDSVGYHGLHKWIRKVRGKPTLCEFCGSIKNIHWANKSWQYKRDPLDWLSLCISCHRKYDMTDEKKAKAIKNLRWYPSAHKEKPAI